MHRRVKGWPFLGGPDDANVADVTCEGRVLDLLCPDNRDCIVHIQRLNGVRNTLVDVHGSRVDVPVRRCGVDRSKESTCVFLDDADGVASAPKIGHVVRALPRCPVPAGRSRAQQPTGLEFVEYLVGILWEDVLIDGDGKFVGGSQEMRREDVRVTRIENCLFERLSGKRLGVLNEVGV